MSSLGSPNPFFIAGKKAYEVERSLRFNDDDSANLTRTPSSAGNRKTFTYSCWFKRGNLGTQSGAFLKSGSSSSNYFKINIANDHKLYVLATISGGYTEYFRSTQLFRDPSAWYHLVLRWDTTNSTAGDRVRVYLNGTEITDHSGSNPALNLDGFVNNTVQHEIGSDSGNSQYWDGYIAEVNLIDGFSYDPSYFGETDVITGQWNPKKYTGSYGTNGFYLNFSDNSGTTATTLGKDSSGNGNNFTPNNFVTGDAVKDSPTNNFAVLRTHSTPEASGVALAEGNLKYTTGSSGGAGEQNRIAISTFLPTSGKWYAEVMATSSSGNQTAGIIPYAVEESPTSNRPRYNIVNFNTGQILKNLSGSGTTDTYGASISTNDVLCIYMDMDAKTVYYGKNGQWGDGSGSWNQSTPTSGSALGNSFFNNKTGGHEGFGISIMSVTGGASITCTANFGQDSTFAGTLSAGGNTDANGIGDFKYTVPANALAMCSANLPDPTILLPNKHFDTLLWSGNATTSDRSITGLNFQPDWAWTKTRNHAYHHVLFDAVRGPSNRLNSDQDFEENYTSGGVLASFDNDGITWDYGTGNEWWNESGKDYVAWNWNAGDTDGKTYTVKVVDDSGNKYRFDDFGTSAVTLDLAEGGTYVFDQSDSSNATHPLRFYTAADKTGGEYTTGVTTSGTAGSSGATVTITIAASAPTLYYQCSSHAGMGGQINTNSTLGSSNFDGSIQATVKASPTSGFSIIKYTGNGSNSSSVGHGLGVTPDAVIIKRRDGTSNWLFESPHTHNGRGMYLNFADGSGSSGTDTTSRSSSLVTFNNSSDTNRRVNFNGETYVMYCFSNVASYSKIGSYIGNGNSNGAFVFTGFRPAWVMLKISNSTGNWIIHDAIRDGFNVRNEILIANTTDVESNNAVDIDIVSNGFKLRSSGGAHNGSGNTYIYLAFAESPFKNSRAR